MVWGDLKVKLTQNTIQIPKNNVKLTKIIKFSPSFFYYIAKSAISPKEILEIQRSILERCRAFNGVVGIQQHDFLHVKVVADVVHHLLIVEILIPQEADWWFLADDNHEIHDTKDEWQYDEYYVLEDHPLLASKLIFLVNLDDLLAFLFEIFLRCLLFFLALLCLRGGIYPVSF